MAKIDIEMGAEKKKLLNVNSISANERQKCFKNVMPDWNNPTLKRKTNYKMIERYRADKENFLRNFFEANKFLEVCYRHVFIRIIYQMLFEFDVELNKRSRNYQMNESTKKQEELDMFKDEFKEFLEKLSAKTLKLKDKKCLKAVLQVTAVFMLILNNEAEIKNVLDNEDDDELKAFFDLMLLLKKRKTIEFQKEFENFIRNSVKIYGDYFRFAIKHHVRLLSIIAKRLDLSPSVNFIFSQFPHVGINATILRSIQEIELFTAVIIEPFKCRTLENLVGLALKNNFKEIENIETFQQNEIIVNASEQCLKIKPNQITKHLKFWSKLADEREFALFLFGRKSDQSESVFEKILATKGTSCLIELFWDKFQLCTKEQILNLVRSFFEVFSFSCLLINIFNFAAKPARKVFAKLCH